MALLTLQFCPSVISNSIGRKYISVLLIYHICVIFMASWKTDTEGFQEPGILAISLPNTVDMQGPFYSVEGEKS